MRLIASFACGLLFALGLGVSGMTSPRKVVAFLDVFGGWDPSLLLVMVAAIAVFAAGDRLARARSRPIVGSSFPPRPYRRVDAPLVIGAALFGVGWGIAGYCPGPAIVALASGAVAPLVFTASMLLGMAGAAAVLAALSGPTAPKNRHGRRVSQGAD